MKKGLTYKEYLNKATNEQLEMILRHEECEKITKEGIDKVKNLKKKVDILVFAELRCEDAATTIPILNQLCNLNEKINVKFYYKTENEEFISKLIGDGKIPTIISMNEEKRVLDSYLEFPRIVREKIAGKSDEDRKKVVKQVRSGNFNKDIQNDLIELITKDQKGNR